MGGSAMDGPQRGCVGKEVRIAVIIFTALTLLHLTYILVTHIAFFFTEEFVKSFRWYWHPAPCQTEPEVLLDMLNLTSGASSVFRQLSLPGVACYGTLWGILRNRSFLPWENNVDFCILNSEWKKVPFTKLRRAFRDEGITLENFDWYSGSYTITKGRAKGEINVFFDCSSFFLFNQRENYDHTGEFYESSADRPKQQPKPELPPQWACAMSVASTAARFVHDINRPLPHWLLRPPFSVESLDGVAVNVPQDGLEIQKYLYPDDWWLEAKPTGC